MSYGGVITIAGEIYPKNIPYYYNPITLGYEVAQQAGGVGGGGDASAANQLLGNASLASIDTKLPALLAGRIPVVLPAGGAGLTDLELRATPVPVSATALPLPSGAATSPKQDTGNASLASIDGKMANPLPVTGPLTDAQVRATPLPVSGTVALDAPSLAALETIQVGSSALPTGASTEATLALLDTDLKAELGSVADRPSAYTVLDRLYQLGVKLDAQAKAGATEATMRKVLTALNKPAAPSTTTLLHR